jgi:hypothetical protein
MPVIASSMIFDVALMAAATQIVRQTVADE